MPYPDNTPTLGDLPGLSPEEIAALPVEMLAILQREVEQHLDRGKEAKARLEGALALRYADRAAAVRRGAGKDTGTVRFTDDMNRTVWQPQMEGGKAARELPGIVDQVMTLGLFTQETGPDGATAWRHDPEKGEVRRLVCRSGNPWGLPAKDRSGRLDPTEPPDLGALLTKINQPRKG